MQLIVYLLRSNTLEPIPYCSCTYARLICKCVRAHHYDVKQCNDMLDHTSVAIDALAYIATYLRVCDRSYCPALKRIAADCTNIHEVVCSVLISFCFD
jgi:hypothetical protein